MTTPTTAVERFIQDAVKGGWSCKSCVEVEKNYEWYLSDIMLEPECWQSVEKQRGWELSAGPGRKPRYVHMMHGLIDALAEGRTIEQYLTTIE